MRQKRGWPWIASVGLLLLNGCGIEKINSGGNGDFSATGELHQARVNHSATLLADGRVLVIGGTSTASEEGNLRSAEVYDPATGLFTLVEGGMAYRRAEHHAVPLEDGTILVVGGGDRTAEIYDPATRTFRTTGQLNTIDRVRSVVPVGGGRVLITGDDPNRYYELYDAAAGQFESLTPYRFPSQNRPSRRIGATATRLSDGRVVVVGTIFGAAVRGYVEIIDFTSEEVSFSTLNLRFGHTVTLLTDGKVLIAGGSTNAQNRPSGTFLPTRRAELFDPKNESVAPTGSMNSPRFDHSAILLADGAVLMIGGFDGDAEAYDPVSGQFRLVESDLGRVRGGSSTTLLPDGSVLIVGGYGENFAPRERAAIFRP